MLQLANIFENFRDVCIKIYTLDPAWYYTSPGLAWDAMLKITMVKQQLLSDEFCFELVQNRIRGGIAMVSKRFGQARINIIWVTTTIAIRYSIF